MTTLHAQQTRPSERDGADARTPEGSQTQQRTSRALVSVIAISLLVGLTAAAILGVELLHSQGDVASAPPAAPSAQVVLGGGPDQPPEPWELQSILAAAGNELRALGLPAPPSECTGEAAAGAAVALVSARRTLDKDPVAAVPLAEKAVTACPDWAAAYNVYGNALQTSDRLDEAAEAYERALALVPDYDAPRFNLGLVQLQRKDPVAIATFSQLIAQKPSYPDVYKSRGQAYVFAKRYREGLADLEESLKREPDDGTTWLMTAQLREQLKLPGAKDAYCEAAALNVEAAQRHCKR